jgi:ParB-like chromosome segregation protein Spo0J
MSEPATPNGPTSVEAFRYLRFETLPLASITVPSKRMRALREEVVDNLVQSMQKGQLQPILVRSTGPGCFELVAGRHRYEAAQKLGWKSIKAAIVEGMDADRILLAEIDENLVRANLTPAEEAAHHAMRKEIYERLYPQTKKGGDRRSPKAKAKSNTQSAYVNDAARKTGKSHDTINRAVKRGKNIPNVSELAGTSLDKGGELDALAALGEEAPEEQQQLIEQATAGEEVSAKTSLKQRRPRRSATDIALEHLGIVVARISGMGTSLENVQVPRLPPELVEQYLEEFDEAMRGFRQFRDRIKEAGRPPGRGEGKRRKGGPKDIPANVGVKVDVSH